MFIRVTVLLILFPVFSNLGTFLTKLSVMIYNLLAGVRPLTTIPHPSIAAIRPLIGLITAVVASRYLWKMMTEQSSEPTDQEDTTDA